MDRWVFDIRGRRVLRACLGIADVLVAELDDGGGDVASFTVDGALWQLYRPDGSLATERTWDEAQHADAAAVGARVGDIVEDFAIGGDGRLRVRFCSGSVLVVDGSVDDDHGACYAWMVRSEAGCIGVDGDGTLGDLARHDELD